MTDDPRKTLRDAGVDVPELEHYEDCAGEIKWTGRRDPVVERADAAILALARLVAKYKWQLDGVLDRYVKTVAGEWGIPHWYGDKRPPDDEVMNDADAREEWKRRLVLDLKTDEWDELH